MAGSELHIQRLRLPAQPSGGGAQGMAARIEDALRVSSKPAALAHRHVLVRRLRLVAAPDASAQSLALLFERAWQRIAAEAYPIASAPAAADAVWAADEATARVALISRWAQGGDTTAWFWAQVRGRAQGESWVQRSVALLLAPLDEAPASAGSAAAAGGAGRSALVHAGFAAIALHGALPAFLQQVGDTQAAALADLLNADSSTRASAWRSVEAVLPAEATASGAGRRRLAAALQVGRVGLRQATGESGWQNSDRLPVAAVVAVAVADDGITPAGDTARVAAAALSSPTATDTVLRPVAVADRLVSPRSASTSSGEGLASAWAGLWLLLPLLLRHGLDASDTPLAALAATMHAACARFGVPGDDAMHDGIAALGPVATDDDGKTLAAHWLRSARIAALHEARLPLRHIVHRSGIVWVSAKRIDIEFPLAAADVRIRRAGFDLDPGFLPWLGRIVHFHYV
jgi:hypothetical protein